MKKLLAILTITMFLAVPSFAESPTVAATGQMDDSKPCGDDCLDCVNGGKNNGKGGTDTTGTGADGDVKTL